MNWQEIVNNSELVYASVAEDKGFRTWSLKETTCKVSFYETFPLEDIDRIICSMLESNNGFIEENKIATILGFNVFDDFEATPKQYADKAEFDIFKAIIKPVLGWGIVEQISEKGLPVIFKLTDLGYRALSLGEKYKFYTGDKELLENTNIKPAGLKENIFFPFYSSLGEFSEITGKTQIKYDQVDINDAFKIVESELIKRHNLQSKENYQIFKSEPTNHFKLSSIQVEIRLYKQGTEYFPIIFYNSKICNEATDLLNSQDNTDSKEKKIEWGLYLKLLKDPSAVLDYKSIRPFEDLLDLDSLVEDTRLCWEDNQLFTFMGENANANQWFNISNHCPIDVLKLYFKTYRDNLDWTSISLRIDDVFLIQNATLFPWNFEIISAKEDISIEILKTLLLIPELKEYEWDWDRIMPLLDFEFIKSNINTINFELSELTEINNNEVKRLIEIYPDKKWNWLFISTDYDLFFILENIQQFSGFLNLKILINRAFASENHTKLFCDSAHFVQVLLSAQEFTLSDYQPNLANYFWTDQLISLLESSGYLTWESGSFVLGFECNPFIEWNPDFFTKYNSKIKTQKGSNFISARISETGIINKFPDFNWNWDIISENENLINDSEFLISVKDKLNFDILLKRISGQTLEAVFFKANVLSYLEINSGCWKDVTEKSSKEFILNHIDYNWDWSILTKRFCSTIKIDSLGNPKWVNKWDWNYLTTNIDLSIIEDKLDLYLEYWDWDYLSINLNKEFVINHLPEYNDYWNWDMLLKKRFEKGDLQPSKYLTEVAKCIYVFNEELKQQLWKTITSKFDYEELENLVSQTFNQDVFQWDYSYFYDLTSFNPRQYLNENIEFVDWKTLSGSIALNKSFQYDKSLFSYEVWLKDIFRLLKNKSYKWDFKSLSRLDNINWNDSILSIESEKWDWEYLSEFSSCFKKERDFLRRFRKFAKFINFTSFSKRTDSDITEKLLAETISNDWDWTSLSENLSVKLSLAFIKENKEKPWEWETLSGRNDIKFENEIFIELLNQNWDWEAISTRADIAFSEELVIKLIGKPINWYLISQNKSFVPNSKTLSLLKSQNIDWKAISKNINLSTEILWDYKESLDWKFITQNEVVDISDISFLSKYQNYVDWDFISQSDKFKMYTENLKLFKDKLNWIEINSRKDFRITNELLEPFSDVLNWSNVSESLEIQFTEELIEKYRKNWDWQLLRKNPQIIEKIGNAKSKYKEEFNCVEFLEQFDREPYIYHFTHLFNAIDIIKSRKILSRNKADGKFSNAAGNLVARRSTAHDYARFYFRTQTPTQFYNECLGMDSKSGKEGWAFDGYDWKGNKIWSKIWKSYYPQFRNLGLPRCPIPVFFKFNLKEVIMKISNKCFYSTGNMQTNWARVEKVSENPKSLNTLHLYSEVSDYENYKQYSQQEFLVLEEFDFSTLDSFEIICYNEEYANLLKSQLGNDPICKKINADGWDIFHRMNRELIVNFDNNEVSIRSEYLDNAYLSIKGSGLKNTQILNIEKIIKETDDEIMAYPELRFTITEKPIEVRFVDLALGKREWIVYSNYSTNKNSSIISTDYSESLISEDLIEEFLQLEVRLKLKISRSLFEPKMVDSNHGIAHTTRVLFGTCLILKYSDMISSQIKDAIYYSAIIHDLGKSSDMEGPSHGLKSAKKYDSKISEFVLEKDTQNQALNAIIYHSVADSECPSMVKDSIIWKVLKDADALDRGRFRSKCDKSYLRLELFKTEIGNRIINFMDLLPGLTNDIKWNDPYRDLIACIKNK
ncbi:MAG TPA: DarT ssDNA thymidine ADP-ribosyltransferase family protein [Bacteroidales bacterium]|mgnify:CR=1 FL=1|nr:DarT ssDNA thymidine ADP-ribosyltransferase family protein [Bacteroidales bacterium]